MNRKPAPARPVSRLPRPPDLAGLSRLLLVARGCTDLARLPRQGAPLDLIAHDPRRRRIVLVVACPRPRRFAVLVELLSDRRLAKLVRPALALVQLHCWRPRGRGWLVEVVELGPEDYAGQAAGHFKMADRWG